MLLIFKVKKRINLVINSLGLGDLTLCSMIIEIRSSDSIIYEEFPLYPLNLLLSDIGGIAGLVMGINLVHIISMSIEYIEDLIRMTTKQLKRDHVYIQRTQL